LLIGETNREIFLCQIADGYRLTSSLKYVAGDSSVPE
jgi:hypothetical protein